MKVQSETELIELIINWVKENKLTNGLRSIEISADTNLMERGILDSLGFVELILFLESQSGCQVDLMDVDPAEFTVVKGLCKIALRNHQ